MNKPEAIAAVEERVTTQAIAWVDSDILFLRAPSGLELPNGIDFLASAPDVGVIGSTGANDPNDLFWQDPPLVRLSSLAREMSMVVFSTKYSRVNKLNVIQSDYDDTRARFATGDWARWKPEDISGWKRVLHQVINPYSYRTASQMFLAFQVRRKYRADRSLIDPDRVDPTKFLETMAVRWL